MNLSDYIKEAKRELSMRRSVYARRVAEARMRKEEADHKILLQIGIVRELERLQRLDEESKNQQMNLL